MQIDMHYYGVYALARLAGLKPGAARTIAYASQYVDDAVEEEIQHHENGNKFAPVLTAHRLIEIVENRDPEDQPFVWVPFHFFPGNEGQEFTRRLICRKDGLLINELIDHYIALGDHPFSLELIGLVAHVYADTFAHFGFSGISSRRNRVDAASITYKNATAPTATYLEEKLRSFFRRFGFQGGLWENIKRRVMSDGAEVLSGALGHGAVATLPDLPYLEWSFDYEFPELTDGASDRNNTDDFLEGCQKLHQMFQRFLAKNPEQGDGGGVDFVDVSPKIRELLSFQHGKNERSQNWRRAFFNGELGLPDGEEIPPYDPREWDRKRDHFASLTQPESIADEPVYRFHQAAGLHRHYVLKEFFPDQSLIVV